jgi:nicotinamidase-related amidase
MKPIFFLDLDTQKDFLYPNGACYLRRAEKVLPVLRKLSDFAQERGFPVISTICVHEEDDKNFHGLLPHCRRGKDGAHKVPESLLLQNRTIENRLLDRNLAFLVEQYNQLILEKSDFSFFANPNATRLLAALGKNVFVYGCFEETIQQTVVGLLQRQLQVVIVEDACVLMQAIMAKKFLGILETQGVRRISSRQLFATLTD